MPDHFVPSPHPLRNPEFRLLWIGSSISGLGDQFYLVALPWLIVQLTGSSVVLGTVTMTAAIPRAALMLLGGAVSDRASPRRIMIATASARTVLVAAIAALIWTHVLQLWQLYLLAFTFGVADAFAGPAAQTYLPSLVRPEQLPAANSVFQSTAQISTLMAPAPAGLLIKTFGTAWAFLIDAVSFLFVIGALCRLPDPKRTSTGTPRANMLRSILDGLEYVKRDVALSSFMQLIAVLNFAIAGPASVGLAFIAKQRFGTPAAFGALMSAVGAGSLTGVLLAGVAKHRKRGRVLLLAGIIIGLCLAGISRLSQLPALVTVLFLMSATAAFLNVQLIAWFQQRVDRAMLGRVMSVLMFAAVGLIPFSLAAAGLAIKWSLPGMFLTAGAMVVSVSLLAAAHRPVREID
ncbi:MAG: MFS transporter [Acidobacteriaceae bacterium]|nr:MFS transporter [Acidobacteriaceae bacterium]